jgi:hypothetical protein
MLNYIAQIVLLLISFNFSSVCAAQSLPATLGYPELDGLVLGMSQQSIEKKFGIGFKQSLHFNSGIVFSKNININQSVINLTVDNRSKRLVEIIVGINDKESLRDFLNKQKSTATYLLKAYSDLHMLGLFATHTSDVVIICTGKDQVLFYQESAHVKDLEFWADVGLINGDWFRFRINQMQLSQKSIKFEMLCLTK